MIMPHLVNPFFSSPLWLASRSKWRIHLPIKILHSTTEEAECFNYTEFTPEYNDILVFSFDDEINRHCKDVSVEVV
jgi:hypothetical protein